MSLINDMGGFPIDSIIKDFSNGEVTITFNIPENIPEDTYCLNIYVDGELYKTKTVTIVSEPIVKDNVVVYTSKDKTAKIYSDVSFGRICYGIIKDIEYYEYDKELDLGSYLVDGDIKRIQYITLDYINASGVGPSNRVTYFDLRRLDTSGATSFYDAFANSHYLKTINVTGLDTSNVTNMESCFAKSELLSTIIGINTWDTSNVTNMLFCFYKCSSLTTLDLSGWDVSNVTKMRDMFYSCISLESLDISGWDLTNTSIQDMFKDCNKLTTIYARGCNQTTIDKLNSVKPSGCTIVTE